MITAAIAAAVLGILVVSYLNWVTNEYRLSKRSHAWTQALNLCEAGVELALAELNHVYRQDPSKAFLTAGGWSAPASSTCQKTVTGFTDSTGKVVGNFIVSVRSFTSKYPIIECAAQATGSGNTNAVTRTLRVVVQRQVNSGYALAGKEFIKLHMNGKTLDSYNSSNPSESTGGLYDVTKRTAHANIGSPSSSASAITLDQSAVHGTASTGAGGHVTFSASSVGATFAPGERSTTEADAESKSWVTHDFVMDFPDVVVPPALSIAPNLGDVKGGTISSGDWRVKNIDMKSLTLTVTGNVRLYVTGDVNITGNGVLIISPGASLEVYVAGPVNVSGSGIVNATMLAAANKWNGLNNSKSWRIWGSSDFIGAVYAPYAYVELGGAAQFYGSFVGYRIDASPAGIHYDEALGTGSTGSGPYKCLSWQPLVYRGGAWVMETN